MLGHSDPTQVKVHGFRPEKKTWQEKHFVTVIDLHGVPWSGDAGLLIQCQLHSSARGLVPQNFSSIFLELFVLK